MSEAVDNTGLVGLKLKLQKAYGAIKRFRERAETAETAKANLEKQVTTLTNDLTLLKDSTDAKRVAELTSELRTIKHKDAFRKLALKAGAKPEGVDDLFALSGHKAETDLVDEAGMTKLIDEQKAKRGYLFGQTTPTEGEQLAEGEQAPEIKPGPGSGQGAPLKTGPKFTEAQLSDPVFVMRNYDAITEASAARVAAGQV